MAGSILWRGYGPDGALPVAQYAVRVDKSNAAAITTTGSHPLMVAVTGASVPRLPGGFKMRYVNAYSLSNPKIKRKFYIGAGAAFLAILAGSTITTEDYPATDDSPGFASVWAVTSYRGEKIDYANYAIDTGLTDTGA